MFTKKEIQEAVDKEIDILYHLSPLIRLHESDSAAYSECMTLLTHHSQRLQYWVDRLTGD